MQGRRAGRHLIRIAVLALLLTVAAGTLAARDRVHGHVGIRVTIPETFDLIINSAGVPCIRSSAQGRRQFTLAGQTDADDVHLEPCAADHRPSDHLAVQAMGGVAQLVVEPI